YSGWGLTDERMEVPRRTRKLSTLQVFAAAYILYAKYADPETGYAMSLSDAIEVIINQRQEAARKLGIDLDIVAPFDDGAGSLDQGEFPQNDAQA
ncbi:MAG: hypothetical protein U1D69_14400, partial [Polynucleobacter sp.]|nr:hypothetical protein [Polynucleobacter sp.]